MLVFILAIDTALACGGLLGPTRDGVTQSSQEVAFQIDEAANQTTMHVQVHFKAPDDSIAWIVPVQGIPDVFRSHADLFQRLGAATRPTFPIDGVLDASCPDYQVPNIHQATGDHPTSTFSWYHDTGTPDPDPVLVLDADRIGPYEVTTLAADDTEALTDWLTVHGYRVPQTLDDTLAPYVDTGMNFVAIQLAKEVNHHSGTLPPLAFRYEGTTPVLPLQLTRLAAPLDMPMTVYIIGEHRGVPLNTRHVRLNARAIDTFGDIRGGNLDDVVRRAADEAGGHAFATLAAIEDPRFTPLVYQPDAYDPESLHGLTDAVDFVLALPAAGFVLTPEVVAALAPYFPLPSNIQPGSEGMFYSDPERFRDDFDAFVFDPVDVSDSLVEHVIVPRMTAQTLLDNVPYLTRLHSSFSPGEMTVDPEFGVNPDLPPVYPRQPVEVLFACDETDGERARKSPQLITWLTGQQLWLPSLAEMTATRTLYVDYISLDVPAALTIEQMSTSGPPEVLYDYSVEPTTPPQTGDTASDDTAAEPSGGDAAGASGCGCQAANAPASLGLLAGLLGWMRRRRAA